MKNSLAIFHEVSHGLGRMLLTIQGKALLGLN